MKLGGVGLGGVTLQDEKSKRGAGTKMARYIPAGEARSVSQRPRHDPQRIIALSAAFWL